MKSLPDLDKFLATLDSTRAAQSPLPERLAYCFGRSEELRRKIREENAELDLLSAQIPALLESLQEVSEATGNVLGTVKKTLLDLRGIQEDSKPQGAKPLSLQDIKKLADDAKAEAAELTADEELEHVINS